MSDIIDSFHKIIDKREVLIDTLEKENQQLKAQIEFLREGLNTIMTGIVQSEKTAFLAGFEPRIAAGKLLMEFQRIKPKTNA